MKLPRPAPSYDSQNEAQARAALESADRQNYKRDGDVEITAAQRLIMTDSGTGRRCVVTLTNGAFTFTPL